MIFIFVLEVLAEEYHVKNKDELLCIPAIKYLDNLTGSFRFLIVAYSAYADCLQSLKTGISFMVPGAFIVVDI